MPIIPGILEKRLHLTAQGHKKLKNAVFLTKMQENCFLAKTKHQIIVSLLMHANMLLVILKWVVQQLLM